MFCVLSISPKLVQMLLFLFQDMKKLQGQMIAEQEALYGSKPSPSKPQSVKKGSRMSTGGAASRRVSLGGAMLQTPKPDSKATTNSRATRKTDKVHQIDQLSYLEDGISCLSSGSLFKLYFWLYLRGCQFLA